MNRLNAELYLQTQAMKLSVPLLVATPKNMPLKGKRRPAMAWPYIK